MTYCEKCGSKIRESVSFCPSCGAKKHDEINSNDDCVTNENIYQNDESGVVYKYNSASIGGIIVACGTLAVSINTIITQEKASQHKFWDPSEGTYITPGYNPGSITFFVILAILALIILVVSIKKLRTKCKYHKCSYCQKTTVIPCDAQSCDCDVCGQKILITNGKPECFHSKKRVKIMKKSLIALIAILLISTVLSGCSKESRSESSAAQTNFDSTTVEETTEENDEYEDAVVDILNSTSFMDSIDPSYVQNGLCSDITFGQLLASMFENPQLDITPTKTRDTGTLLGYQVTVSGNYRNTPDGYYNNSGNAYIVINLTNDICTLTGDHDYKSAAEYYAFEVTGFY